MLIHHYTMYEPTACSKIRKFENNHEMPQEMSDADTSPSIGQDNQISLLVIPPTGQFTNGPAVLTNTHVVNRPTLAPTMLSKSPISALRLLTTGR